MKDFIAAMEVWQIAGTMMLAFLFYLLMMVTFPITTLFVTLFGLLWGSMVALARVIKEDL